MIPICYCEMQCAGLWKQKTKMVDYSDKQQQERFKSYLNIHLKKEQQELPLSGQIQALHKKDRNKWWQLAINVAAILFFGYSFYYDITQLSPVVFYVIFGVFGINVGLIFYQKKQIHQLINYLEWKKQHEG